MNNIEYKITRINQKKNNNDELMHYGRKGMKWGQNIFDTISSTAKRASSAAKSVSLYGNKEAYAKRDLLKSITRDMISKDRAYGTNIRNLGSNTQQMYNRIYRDHKLGGSLKNKIEQANQIFGKNSNWGSVNYNKSMTYKVDSGKRMVNKFMEEFSGKSIFTKAVKDNADYGRDFMMSNRVMLGILDNPYLNYGD